MVRFVLALLVVAVLAVLALIVVLGFRAVAGGDRSSGTEAADPVQKIAFALLVALILYVAFQGAA